jgi:hypothetical protein
LRTRFKASFARDLRTLRDKGLLGRIKTLIENVEQAKNLADIAGL